MTDTVAESAEAVHLEREDAVKEALAHFAGLGVAATEGDDFEVHFREGGFGLPAGGWYWIDLHVTEDVTRDPEPTECRALVLASAAEAPVLDGEVINPAKVPAGLRSFIISLLQNGDSLFNFTRPPTLDGHALVVDPPFSLTRAPVVIGVDLSKGPDVSAEVTLLDGVPVSARILPAPPAPLPIFKGDAGPKAPRGMAFGDATAALEAAAKDSPVVSQPPQAEPTPEGAQPEQAGEKGEDEGATPAGVFIPDSAYGLTDDAWAEILAAGAEAGERRTPAHVKKPRGRRLTVTTPIEVAAAAGALPPPALILGGDSNPQYQKKADALRALAAEGNVEALMIYPAIGGVNTYCRMLRRYRDALVEGCKARETQAISASPAAAQVADIKDTLAAINAGVAAIENQGAGA